MCSARSWLIQSIQLVALSLAACSGGSSGSGTPPPPTPTINSFTVAPSFVTTGQSATLTWSVASATSLSISGIGTVTGTSVKVTPSADTDYVLTATNQYGSTTAKSSLAVFPPPKYWFAAWPNLPDPNWGSVDFVALFGPTAPWPIAASHIQVFQIETYELELFSDAVLSELFADLKRRHMALVFNWGPLLQHDCGTGEGFQGAGALHYAQTIRDHGGSPQYISFDEPYQMASQGPCHWTPEQVAQNAAAQVAIVRTIFPDVIVGDIEGVSAEHMNPGYLDGLQAWFDAWQRVTGAPFAFFHADINRVTDWKPVITVLQIALKQRHIPFGVLNTGGDAIGDLAWVTAAKALYADYENRGGGIPEQVVFQSWMQYPRHLLPETDPSTFMYFVNSYFRDRTTLSFSVTGDLAHGRLMLKDSGSALPGAAISVTAVPTYGNGLPAAFKSAGNIVPVGTNAIEFGARVNAECAWSPATDFYLSSFNFDAGKAGAIGGDFGNQLTGWGVSGTADVQLTNSELHVRAGPDDLMYLNGPTPSFNGVGLPFTFTVNATIPSSSRGGGCAVVMFVKDGNVETGRVSIQLAPLPISIATTTTAVDGTFELNLPVLPADYELWADYPGSDTLWPASAGVAISTNPSLNLITASLPSGTIDTAYAQTLVATGGLVPYLWVGTGVPPGLTLHEDGTLAGTPKAAGTYTVSVSVVDDSAQTQIVSKSLPIVIQ